MHESTSLEVPNGTIADAPPADPLATVVQLLREVRDLLTRQIAGAAESLRADEAAGLVGLSPASWWRLHAAAKVPRPIKLGGASCFALAHNGVGSADGVTDVWTRQDRRCSIQVLQSHSRLHDALGRYSRRIPPHSHDWRSGPCNR